MRIQMKIDVRTSKGSYPVYTQKGALENAAGIIGTEHRSFIVTDSGVPLKWVEMLKNQLPGSEVFTFPMGEESKNISVWQSIIEAMLSAGISRKDTLVSIGGGVAGDMGGFAAATYMRGIRFVNIPTTTLSQIDSGIGGKTAIDHAGIKNCIGAFWQPAAVIADPNTLSTLPKRHVSNGLAEAVKAGIIRDPKLFEIFEKDDYLDHIDTIIERSLLFKKAIVEEDEFETGSRKLLNFGHTLGHAYESIFGLNSYLHGECVAMGMMDIIEDPQLKKRLKDVLVRIELPYSCSADPEKVIELVRNDKKADHDTVTIVQADKVGEAYLKTIGIDDLKWRLTK